MLKALAFLLIACLILSVGLFAAGSLANDTASQFAHAALGIVTALAFWKWMPLGIHEQFSPTPADKRPKQALMASPSLVIAIALLAFGFSGPDPFATFLGTAFLVHSILWITSVLTDTEVI